MFPAHIERKNYQYWDQEFGGARIAVFKRTDLVDGIPLYVFDFVVTGLDESAGYSHLPDMPERYRVHTDGDGTLWIEPCLGVMVDCEEPGISYSVGPDNLGRVANAYGG